MLLPKFLVLNPSVSFVTISEAIHHHANENGVALISHSFGLSIDASNFLFEEPTNAKFISYHTGAGTKKRSLSKIKCCKYVYDNFPGNDLQIVIPHLHQLRPGSKNEVIASKLLSKFDKCCFLTSVDFHKHLSKTLGYNDAQMKEKYKHLSAKGNAMLFYSLDYPAAVLITIPEDENQSIHNLFLNANDNAKAFLTIHEDIFDVEKMQFVLLNLVAAVNHEREDFVKYKYCEKCDINMMIFKEDLQNDSFWKGVKRRMQEAIESNIHEEDQLQDEDWREFVFKVSN